MVTVISTPGLDPHPGYILSRSVHPLEGQTGDTVMIRTWTATAGSFLLVTRPLLWSVISGK